MNQVEVVRAVLPAPEVRRAIRKAAGLTLQDVADLAEVAPSTVARWETSGANEPTGRNARWYAQYLAQLQDSLLGDAPVA